MDRSMTQPTEPAACDHGAHPPRAPFAPPPRATLESAAAMLRAAGDPARLRLLLRLAEGERCVTELAEEEGDKLATVSARLQQLHAARLVSRRREAKHIHYALADGHVARLLRDILDHAAEGAPSARSPEGDGS
jgi:ArsR family transcriptional regulator